MSKIMPYNRLDATNYAMKWAKGRNVKYFNFDMLGGDCTNFISQCLYSGNCNMNYSKINGWYYISANNRSPSWTANNFLYNFLINNRLQGPFAEVSNINKIQIGDIVQLNFEDDLLFDHSLIVTKIHEPRNYDNILICSHTFDRLNAPISSISFSKIRYLHIPGSLV